MKMLIKSPMLATAVDLAKLRYPVIAQPKVDGIRCLVQGGPKPQAVTRKFLPVPNEVVRATLEALGTYIGRDVLLDGELIVGSGKDFQATSSGIMSRDGVPDWTYVVFDVVDAQRGGGLKAPYEARLETAAGLVNLVAKTKWSGAADNRLVLIDHRWCAAEPQLLAYEHEQVQAGWEGICLRGLDGAYKEGRSTVRENGLLKFKRFLDGEAKVTGYEPYHENHNVATRHATGGVKRSQAKAGKVAVAKLGTLLVQDLKSGIEFGVGSGFTDGQRVMFWKERHELVGRLVKYKYQPTGVKEAPRFPVFLGFRHEADAS